MENIRKIKNSLVTQSAKYQVVEKLCNRLDRANELIHNSLNHFLEMNDSNDRIAIRSKNILLPIIDKLDSFIDSIRHSGQ